MTGARKGSSGPFATTDDVENVSGVPGANVTAALDALAGVTAALTSDDIANASAVAGASVTAALDALLTAVAALQADVAALQPAPIVSQIGWAPATGGLSNVLTLLAAGHPPGIYEIGWVAIVRTLAATGNVLTNTVTWSSPGFGAESKGGLAAGSWIAALGTVAAGAGNASGTARQLAIHSDGSAAITLQYSAGALTGNPVADLYGCAHLVGA
jgi:hypothetical protein